MALPTARELARKGKKNKKLKGPPLILPDGREIKYAKEKKDSVYVLPQHGLMFCLVPKVASKSINLTVRKSLGIPWEVRRINRVTDFWIRPDQADEFPDCVPVGMIREPVDRFRSAYAFRCDIGFVKKWVVTTVDDCLEHIRLMFGGECTRDVHFKQQVPMLRPVEEIWRFDRIGEWWARVQAMSRLPLLDLEKFNWARREKPELTKAQDEALREMYWQDVQAYERAI